MTKEDKLGYAHLLIQPAEKVFAQHHNKIVAEFSEVCKSDDHQMYLQSLAQANPDGYWVMTVKDAQDFFHERIPGMRAIGDHVRAWHLVVFDGKIKVSYIKIKEGGSVYTI